MNQWIKAYVRQVKHLFPFFGRAEKSYLERLRLNLEDCFEDREPGSIEEVIERVGSPEDVVEEYLDHLDLMHIEEHIRKSARWRIFVVCITLVLLVTVVVTSILIWNFYQEYLVRINEMTGYWIEIIE